MFRPYTIDWWERGMEIQFPRSFIYLKFDLFDWTIVSIKYDIYSKQLFFSFLCFSIVIQYIELIKFDEDDATSEELYGTKDIDFYDNEDELNGTAKEKE